MNATTVGTDLAKNVFSVHGVDIHGKVEIKKTISRCKPSDKGSASQKNERESETPLTQVRAAYRLVSALDTPTGSFAWTYDKDGNRQTETLNAGILPYIHPTVQKP